MFGFIGRVGVKEGAAPPAGVAEILLCVFDASGKTRHCFRSVRAGFVPDERFRLMGRQAECLPEHGWLREAMASRSPVALSLSGSQGLCRHLHVLPYEVRRGKWRHACLQVAVEAPDPGRPDGFRSCAFSEERVCLVLADARGEVRCAGAKIPEAFGYRTGGLKGMNLRDLFSEADAGVIEACSPDTNESILGCMLLCRDGSRREVEVRKFSVPENCFLLVLCDASPHPPGEEVSQVGSRERRRIGQDLHDSIGQVLTGISLLSRSLANSLRRGGHAGSADALQISELADDASDQIRQISRGLMSSGIVRRGLFDSLRELARTTAASCRLACEAVLEEGVDFPDGAVETHLYRIAQEAVNNAVRHAGATRVEIAVTQPNGLPQLEVRDNGAWVEPGPGTGGIGMKTMEYRAAAIGARFKVYPGREGTRVVCRLEPDEVPEPKE